MKVTSIASAAALLAATALAAPTDVVYGPPPGGWESVDYPEGTGESLPYYLPPPGGWENVNYPPGTGSNTGGSDKPCPAPAKSPFEFTSTYHVTAVGLKPATARTQLRPKDAIGYFYFGINSDLDTICYNITLFNVVGGYQSPAKTARGACGTPRLTFPNPVGNDKKRISVGCLTGPFITGLMMNGKDTGEGFKVAQIEANPAGFFADSHTKVFSLGVVRGQLS